MRLGVGAAPFRGEVPCGFWRDVFSESDSTIRPQVRLCISSEQTRRRPTAINHAIAVARFPTVFPPNSQRDTNDMSYLSPYIE